MTAKSLTLSSQKNMPSPTNYSLTQPIWYNLRNVDPSNVVNAIKT